LNLPSELILIDLKHFMYLNSTPTS